MGSLADAPAATARTAGATDRPADQPPDKFALHETSQPTVFSPSSACRKAGPAISSMVPGSTSSIIGRVMRTGSRWAFSSVRAARCRRSLSAMFRMAWGERGAVAVALQQRGGEVLEARHVGPMPKVLQDRAVIRPDPELGLERAELAREIRLDRLEFLRGGQQRPLEREPSLQAHHQEIERVGQRAGHLPAAAGAQVPDRDFRQQAPHHRADEKRQGDQGRVLTRSRRRRARRS